MQNLALLAASYVFYGWWDWRFLVLLFSISLLNYLTGRGIERSTKTPARKAFLGLGLLLNIGTLFYFKYFNFFINEIAARCAWLGIHVSNPAAKIILPVGISFYTFLSISYIIDIYQRKLKSPENIMDTLLALSFFPIVLAGPLERPKTLLPQIQKIRTFDSALATDGLRQILWGLFAKVVIADNCAVIVNDVFKNYQSYSGSTLLLGVILFTIQIYADFSGYSNIAIGVGKQFGFDIMQNFNYPYFAANIAEFWRRWNISLTQWFRDYVFLPIAYKVAGRIDSDKFLFINANLFTYIVGISITWLLTGLWHGANYTFILWGGIHGAALIIYHALMKPKKKIFKKLGLRADNRLVLAAEWSMTMGVVCLAWLFFRADSVGQAVSYMYYILNKSLFYMPEVYSRTLLLLIVVAGVIEWIGRKEKYAITAIGLKWPKPLRWSCYYLLAMVIFFFAAKHKQFIYLQF